MPIRIDEGQTQTARIEVISMMARFKNRLLFAALVVFGHIASSSAPAEPLPKQIDNDTFWRLLTEFSETGGVFTSENVVSNEPNFQLVLTRLKASAKPGGVYLGVGPEQNFTYISAMQPGIAFIIDIRRQNLVQHLMYKALFELAPDRADFLSLLFSRKRPDGLKDNSTTEELLTAYKAVPADGETAKADRQAIKDVLVKQHGFPMSAEDLETLEHIHHIFELYGPVTGYASNLTTVDFTNANTNGNFLTVLTTTDDGGANRTFLATEELFRVVKDMEKKNLIVPVVGDFGGDKALKSVAQYLKEQQAAVSVFYVSNVEQYLFQANPAAPNGGIQKFYENVASLPLESSSTFIRVSNNAAIKQAYPGFSSHLGSIQETLQVFKDKGFKNVRDVFAISQE